MAGDQFYLCGAYFPLFINVKTVVSLLHII